jgi:hypothetical protein
MFWYGITTKLNPGRITSYRNEIKDSGLVVLEFMPFIVLISDNLIPIRFSTLRGPQESGDNMN